MCVSKVFYLQARLRSSRHSFENTMDDRVIKWCLKLCMVWRILRETISVGMNSKLVGTIMITTELLFVYMLLCVFLITKIPLMSTTNLVQSPCELVRSLRTPVTDDAVPKCTKKG